MDPAEGSGRKKRRRWRRWLVAIAFLAVAVLISTRARTPSEFAFLDQFQPRKSAWWVGERNTRTWRMSPAKSQRIYLQTLVFSPEAAPKVLPALRDHLALRDGWEITLYDDVDTGFALFEQGESWASFDTAEWYEATDWRGERHETVKPGQCVVQFSEERTWFDRCMDRVAGWFHR